MKGGVRFSVIIPVYNIKYLLPECLESCMAQPEEDAEFICINDGSTDGSLNVIKNYAKEDPRIVLVNKGFDTLSVTRNAGIKAAKGEWIVFLDGDDKLAEGALSKLKAQTDKTPDADIIVYNADIFPAKLDDEPWYKKTLRFPAASYNEFSPKVMFGEPGSMPFVWRNAFSAKFLKENPYGEILFDPELVFGEDVLFQMTAFPRAKRFEFIEDCLYCYRLRRSGGLMDSVHSDDEEVVRRHLTILNKVCYEWQQRGWMDSYGPELLSWTMKFIILKLRVLRHKLRRFYTKRYFEEIVEQFGMEKYAKSLDMAGIAMWKSMKAFKRF